ncbi:MAG: hypothetical protein HOP15_05750 [Planctomycetes bacterium]|nr:hypothetical protein [Planctomycetota bacterium]
MDAELLLRHQRYLRRLVRGLTRDEQAAEDLEQATWLAALQRPPHSSDGLRVWLGRVARNLSLNRRRSEVHEAQRVARGGGRVDARVA